MPRRIRDLDLPVAEVASVPAQHVAHDRYGRVARRLCGRELVGLRIANYFIAVTNVR